MKSCPKCGGVSGYTRSVKYIGKEVRDWDGDQEDTQMDVSWYSEWDGDQEDTQMDVSWYSEIVRCMDCSKGTKVSRFEE